MTDENKREWISNQTECTVCNRIIDAAGQCDCDYDPIWWDTPNRRRLPRDTKANKRAQKRHNERLQS